MKSYIESQLAGARQVVTAMLECVPILGTLEAAAQACITCLSRPLKYLTNGRIPAAGTA